MVGPKIPPSWLNQDTKISHARRCSLPSSTLAHKNKCDDGQIMSISRRHFNHGSMTTMPTKQQPPAQATVACAIFHKFTLAVLWIMPLPPPPSLTSFLHHCKTLPTVSTVHSQKSWSECPLSCNKLSILSAHWRMVFKEVKFGSYCQFSTIYSFIELLTLPLPSLPILPSSQSPTTPMTTANDPC